MLTLRAYQQDAVNAVWEHLRSRDDNPCLVCPTGSGKSLLLAEICKQAVTEWQGRVLVVTHVKELVEQNAEKLRLMLDKELVGVHSAGLNKHDLNHQVITAGIQSIYKKACKLGKFDLIVIDECFPAGTLIDTPRGDIPIEDLYVGQPVRHALGVGDIEAISSRPTYELVKLELSNGKSIECTPNHRFFTDSGWCEASALAVGTCLFSRENLSCLRQNIPPECVERCERQPYQMSVGIGVENQDILLPGMPAVSPQTTPQGTIVANSKGNSNTTTIMESTGADFSQDMPMLWYGNSTTLLRHESNVGKSLESAAILLNILLQESQKPDVQPGYCEEGFCETQGDWTQTAGSRREWDVSDTSTGNVSEKIGCGNGVFCGNIGASTTGRCFKLLQVGCGDSNYPLGNSIERHKPCDEESPQNGCSHSYLAGGIRVVSIVHIKLESPRVVYNLQVAGHPSYYANGVLVHNCHLMPPTGEGMYRTFINDAKVVNPRLRVIGLTATPYRMTSGEICSPANILNHVCYEIGVKELIEQGFLSPLISKAGQQKADISGLHIYGGEFAADETEKLMNTDALVKSAVGEIITATQDRKACIIFCAGVKHGQHVVKVFREQFGKECGFIDANTSVAERARTIARFKGEQEASLFDGVDSPLKYLANVSILTTGFDAPHTDCVALLRPTMSPGLLYQMAGRGLRLAPGKENCLILDFANNLTRHGPIDMLRAGDRPKSKLIGGDSPARECPECNRVSHASIRICPECGYEFPYAEKPKHEAHASTADVISKDIDAEPRDFDVFQTTYTVHWKFNAPPDHPPSMRVNHRIGGYANWISEYVCPQHTGYARDKFVEWWEKRCVLPPPHNTADAVRLANENCLAQTKAIRVKSDGKYDRITAWSLGDIPELDSDLVIGEREKYYIEQENTSSDKTYYMEDDDYEVPF